MSNVERLDKVYNLGEMYAKDMCQSLLYDLNYTKGDEKDGVIPNLDIEIKGDYYDGLATLKMALKLYIEFLSSDINYSYVQELKKEQKVKNISNTTAIYMGNLAEFRNFFNGYCKNKVNAIAKSERDKQNGICEWCGQKHTLQSAHREGEEMVDIVKNILETHFKLADDFYEVDLIKFEDLFVKAHLPIMDHFFFLCKDCHNSYDGKGKNPKVVTTQGLEAKRQC